MSNTVLLVIVGLVILGVVIFLLTRKKAEPRIEAPPEPKKLPTKAAEPAPTPAKAKPKAEPAKEPAKKPAEEAPAKPAPKPEPAVAKEPTPEVAKAPEREVAKEPARAEEPVKEVAPAAEAAEPKPAPPAKPATARERPALAPRKRDVEGLRKGLAKARETEGFFGRLKALFTGRKEIDPQLVEQMEEVLLTSDVGVKTTELLLSDIRDSLKKNELANEDRVWEALRDRATKLLGASGGGLSLKLQPTVVMVVGVNGVGKTTTIGKLATKLRASGMKVVLAAGDTFRAAAVQQLQAWGKRVGCEVVSGKDGANPGAVIFDAIQRAKETGADVVLADTAGRLHTKTNLMEELTKVARTMNKALEGAPHETLLVLDATNGQNAMQQAAMFKEALPITGLVLTKLDGTAKGGIVLGISAEHGLPVRASEFVEAMLGQSSSSTDAAA
ncbi:MAG: signal recognition particle-docking protein FtsY [Polyangiaceae bacterium]|nr:signal recognition particle-docking protein FtsY [Polyangiaceae bacterium]